MTKGRIAALALVGVLAIALTGIAAGVGWLIYTQAGLGWLTARALGAAGEGLVIEGISGTLAGGARVATLRFVGEDIEVRATDAYVRLAPESLIRFRPRLVGLGARELAVVTKPGEPRGKPPDTLELPLNFELADAHVARLVIDLGKGPLDVTDVRLDYSGGRERHRVRDLTLAAYGHAIALTGTINAQAPFGLTASLAAVRREAPQGTIFARVGGNLTEMTVEGGGRSGDARVAATATLHPYDALPLTRVKASITALDLQAFMADLPRTAISAEVALEREREVWLAGPLELTNALHGPYDKDRVPVAALAATVATNLEVVTFKSLEANLGAAGVIAGSGSVEGETAKLTLTTRALDLSGLMSRMRETQLKGRAELVLEAARQRVRAELAQGDIALDLAAERRGERVDISRFRAQARGGIATGEGRVTLAGERPFAVDAAFQRFDPAAWGDFPRGSINGILTAQGTISGPAAHVRFAIRDSRWLDAPLAASGRLHASGERVRDLDVDATLGGNRFSARGALGRADDTLTVRFDAPRLHVIDQALRGAIRGTAQVSGAVKALRVTFDMSGAGLAHKSYGRVKTLDARGTVSLQPDGRFDVAANLRGLATPGYDLASASLTIDGTRGAHAAAIKATGERVDFFARARGGWRPDAGWSGTILELVNRGELPVELAAPVSLTVAPQRLRVEPFTLRVVGGELAVNQLVYERGRLSTAGRIVNLPVRPLVALAGAGPQIAGTLRLTGSWNIAHTPALIGSISIARESGDIAVAITPERRIALGLQSLSVKADLGTRGIVFDGQMRSALATASAQGRVTPVGVGENARYTGASPLELTANVDIAQLAPFAAVVDTAMIVGGAAQARLTARGTLADPRLTGPLTARELAVALPAEGINYRDGVLRAELTARAVRVEQFSIRSGEGVLTAQGTLARTGFDEASVDWRAERFTALSRPDRRLVVSGRGNAGLSAGKLSLTGKLRADDGLFDIGATTLPTLSDDVVIVGRSPAEPVAETRRFKALALDVAVELGNNVHVIGEGLDVWLSGDMRVFTNAQGEIRASGSVNARHGIFVAYGRRLEIDRGRLYFNGPISNPALDFVALRKRQAVEAGVAVTGTLKSPLVRVVSDPPLPQGEALSWLLLGRAPDQAGAGELAALPLAADALLGRATGPLAKRLNLDELALRRGDVGQQFVTLGKRISDRLYVVFEQGLGAAESLLRLEYTLTQRVVLRAQTGRETNSVGIYYRWRWD